MLPITLRELVGSGLDAATADLARDGACLLLARPDAPTDDLAPAQPDEFALAARYPEGMAGLRARGFLLRRRTARSLAARQLELAADRLAILPDALGKPEIWLKTARGEAVRPPLHLSLSARDEWGLVGLALHPLGVDIEASIGAERIPWNLLRADEIARFAPLSQREREVEFLKLWSIKEATLKLIGQGLSVPPEKVAIIAADGEKKYRVMFQNHMPVGHEYGNFVAHFQILRDSRADPKKQFGVAVSLLSN